MPFANPGLVTEPAVPDEAVDPRRRRRTVWSLAPTLHCSVLGTCLGTAEQRRILARLGARDAKDVSEHVLHARLVRIAGSDVQAKPLQKALDRAHGRVIKQFARAETLAELQALWREFSDRGEIPGAYWAALTHPAADSAFVQAVFGEVHMLSHLVGRENRADIRRLRGLEADLQRQAGLIAKLWARLRAARSNPDRGRASTPTPCGRDDFERDVGGDDALRQKLARTKERLAIEHARTEGLRSQLNDEIAQRAELRRSLRVETSKRLALAEELASLRRGPGEKETDGSTPGAARAPSLSGRTVLYVGGRPRQIPRMRELVVDLGGEFLVHDGGVEDNPALLAGLVGRADLVLFPATCVSHEAVLRIKRQCHDSNVRYSVLKNSSISSLLQCINDS